jgi:hypothetical protein
VLLYPNDSWSIFIQLARAIVSTNTIERRFPLIIMKKIVKIVEEEYDNWMLPAPICFTLVIAVEAFSNHFSNHSGMSFIYPNFSRKLSPSGER